VLFLVTTVRLSRGRGEFFSRKGAKARRGGAGGEAALCGSHEDTKMVCSGAALRDIFVPSCEKFLRLCRGSLRLDAFA
jgi:hypothetical protein